MYKGSYIGDSSPSQTIKPPTPEQEAYLRAIEQAVVYPVETVPTVKPQPKRKWWQLFK